MIQLITSIKFIFPTRDDQDYLEYIVLTITYCIGSETKIMNLNINVFNFQIEDLIIYKSEIQYTFKI